MQGFLKNSITYTKKAALGVKEVKKISLSRLRKVFSLMGKNEKIAAISLLLIATLSFAYSVRNFYYQKTNPAADFGGNYTEGLVGQPQYINPLLARSDIDLSLTKLVFSGLYKYNSEGKLVPDLAEDMPQISQDQKQYTINLKKNAKWQNGKPVTADDVIFTIQLLKDPAFKSPLRPLWQATSAEKLSDFSLKLTTKDVSGLFLDNLTLGILPKGVWDGVEPQNFLLSQTNLEAVGNGPYSISEIKKLPSGKIQELTLKSNTDHLSSPKISKLIFKLYDTEEDVLNAFHSHEIAGFGFVPLGSNLHLDEKQEDAKLLSIPLPQYQVVFFNLNNKILSDKNVRQALTLATDRTEVIKEVFKGNALLPSSPFLSTQATEPALADINQAKNILESSGWKIDSQTGIRTNSKKVPAEINLYTNDSPVNSKAAEILANQWRKLEIKVNLTVLPSKQLLDERIKPRTFDVLLYPQKFGADPDPFLFWHSSQVKDPGYNLTGYSNPKADELIVSSRSTTDKATRQKKYEEFNGLIMSQFPVIFLDQTQYIYAADKNIKNLGFKTLYDPSQRFYDSSNWYIKEKRVWK